MIPLPKSSVQNTKGIIKNTKNVYIIKKKLPISNHAMIVNLILCKTKLQSFLTLVLMTEIVPAWTNQRRIEVNLIAC